MPPKETFGRYLKRRRTELDLTQDEVAERGKISQTYVSDLEKSGARGVNKIPTRKLIPKLAQGLGVPISEVEQAAGLQEGVISREHTPEVPHTFVPPSDMHPVILSTGEIWYMRNDEPDPDGRVRLLEAFLSGLQAASQYRN